MVCLLNRPPYSSVPCDRHGGLASSAKLRITSLVLALPLTLPAIS
jgi:hypothetical protein